MGWTFGFEWLSGDESTRFPTISLFRWDTAHGECWADFSPPLVDCLYRFVSSLKLRTLHAKVCMWWIDWTKKKAGKVKENSQTRPARKVGPWELGKHRKAYIYIPMFHLELSASFASCCLIFHSFVWKPPHRPSSFSASAPRLRAKYFVMFSTAPLLSLAAQRTAALERYDNAYR